MVLVRLRRGFLRIGRTLVYRLGEALKIAIDHIGPPNFLVGVAKLDEGVLFFRHARFTCSDLGAAHAGVLV